MATLARNPQSKRSRKRIARNFTMSRPNQRAERRLSEAMTFYHEAVRKSTHGGIEFTKPGAMARW